LSLKTRVVGTAHSENFVILACIVLKGLKANQGCATQSDRQTPNRPWLKRAKHSCRA